MFEKLAKSGLAILWPVQSRRISPGQRAAVASRRRPATAALACHWLNRDGRLECCWHADTTDAPIGELDEHRHSLTSRDSGHSPIQSRVMALAG